MVARRVTASEGDGQSRLANLAAGRAAKAKKVAARAAFVARGRAAAARRRGTACDDALRNHVGAAELASISAKEATPMPPRGGARRPRTDARPRPHPATIKAAPAPKARTVYRAITPHLDGPTNAKMRDFVLGNAWDAAYMCEHLLNLNGAPLGFRGDLLFERGSVDTRHLSPAESDAAHGRPVGYEWLSLCAAAPAAGWEVVCYDPRRAREVVHFAPPPPVPAGRGPANLAPGSGGPDGLEAAVGVIGLNQKDYMGGQPPNVRRGPTTKL